MHSEESTVVTGWAEAAHVAGMAPTKLRRLHAAGQLPAEQVDKVYRFERADLEALRRAAVRPDEAAPSAPPTASAPGDSEGELAARVFACFADGLDPAGTVVKLKLAPAVVRQLYAEWCEMTGALVIPAAHRHRLAAALGTPLTPEALGDEVEDMAAIRRIYRTFEFPCYKCGELMLPDENDWQAVLKSQALRFWYHVECPRDQVEAVAESVEDEDEATDLNDDDAVEAVSEDDDAT
jgi:hypothetical protein